MNTEITITGQIDEMELGYIAQDDDEEFEFREITEDNLAESGKALGLSLEAMHVIWSLFHTVKEHVGEDLRDIWSRLDEFEYKLNDVR